MFTKFLKFAFNLFLVATITVAGLFAAGHYDLIDFYKPFIVTSGSMAPAITTGSIVLVQPKTFGYMVGDIITFKLGKSTTTHRVAELVYQDDRLLYRTRGDANQDPDSNLIAPDQIVGTVTYFVPYVGYAGNFAQTPQGFILLVIVPATIVIYEEFKTLINESIRNAKKFLKKESDQVSSYIFPDKLPHNSIRSFSFADNSHPPPTKSSPTFAFDYRLLLVPALAAMFVFAGASLSYFSDQETSLSNILGASSVYPQTGSLYLDQAGNGYTCQGGATNQDIPLGSFVATAGDPDHTVEVILTGAAPDSNYDLWINQDPGACPLDSPTTIDFVTTDNTGFGQNSTTVPAIDGATVLWISLVSDSQIIRSSSVPIN